MKNYLPLLGSLIVGVLIGLALNSLVVQSPLDPSDQLYPVEFAEDFTDEDIVLAQNLFLDPWSVFQNGHGREYDRILVSKVGSNFPVFTIDAYYNDEIVTSASIDSIKDEYDYERWAPTCASLSCEGEISAEFMEQYPELVIRAKAAGLRP
jgi:hypothetical protein